MIRTLFLSAMVLITGVIMLLVNLLLLTSCGKKPANDTPPVNTSHVQITAFAPLTDLRDTGKISVRIANKTARPKSVLKHHKDE